VPACRGRADMERMETSATSNGTRRLVLVIAAVAMLFQVGDAFSGAAMYIFTRGQAESNPLVQHIVGVAGIAGLFWIKALLVASVAATLARLPGRPALVVAVIFAMSGALGLFSNLPILPNQRIDPGLWLDLLHAHVVAIRAS
jgi:hypothetical protein